MIGGAIAHPLFLAGYIEHLGTGTTDMIADCEAYGLRTPEFVQAEDVRTVIWRRKIITNLDEIVSRQGKKVIELEGEVIEHSEKVTEQTTKSNRVDGESNRVRLTGGRGYVVRVVRHSLHLMRHYPTEALWAPLWVVWHKAWKLKQRRQLMRVPIVNGNG